MPRRLRVEFAGAIYHLMSRGDPAICRDYEDRQTFLRTLGERGDKTGWQVHAPAFTAGQSGATSGITWRSKRR